MSNTQDPKKPKVLLVEDDWMLRDIYEEQLKTEGFLVESASNGEEGITKVTSCMPDVVLLDLLLPKLSGFEFIDIVKKNPATSKIPIIVLTNIWGDVEDLVKRGAVKYLLKSDYTPDQIVEKVREVLEQ